MSDNPSFRKITFNAHETTCAWFEQRYGHGWTTQVRELMDRHMMDTNRSEARAVIDHNKLDSIGADITRNTNRTLGDLHE